MISNSHSLCIRVCVCVAVPPTAFTRSFTHPMGMLFEAPCCGPTKAYASDRFQLLAIQRAQGKQGSEEGVRSKYCGVPRCCEPPPSLLFTAPRHVDPPPGAAAAARPTIAAASSHPSPHCTPHYPQRHMALSLQRVRVQHGNIKNAGRRSTSLHHSKHHLKVLR